MKEEYMFTYENIKALGKAEEFAREKGISAIQTEDYLMAALKTEDTGIGRRFFSEGIAASDVEREIEQGSPLAEEISYDHPEYSYREASDHFKMIKASDVLIKEERPSDTVLDGLDLPVSEELQKAIDYGRNYAVQNSGGEGIDTIYVMLGIARECSSNAYRIVYKLMVRNNKISDAEINAVFNRMLLFRSYLSEYNDGYERRQKAKKTAKAKKITGEDGILDNPYASLIDAITVDLTDRAGRGELSPAIGRDSEIDRLATILVRNNKNNAVLLGKAGIGKTAIIEGLAVKIAEKKMGSLNDISIKSLDPGQLMNPLGLNVEVVTRLLQEAESDRNVIFFIDEMHRFAMAKPLVEFLKPALARGTFRVIGASTEEEWSKAIKGNPALRRRIEEIHVAEPTVKQATKIVKKARIGYENHFMMNYTDEVMNNVCALVKKFYPEKSLPDSALTLLDNTGARLALNSRTFGREKEEYQKRYDDLKQRFEESRKKRYNEEETARLFSELQNMSAERKAGMNSEARRYRRKIRLKDVFETIERETGKKAGMEDIVPDSVRLKKLPEKLGQSVIGQSTATEAMARAVTRAKYGLRRKNRPLGVYLFAGPTGVGKTEMAKVIADEAFNGNLIRLDMSEYSSETGKKRFLGSDPGYVGYGETDTLIDKVNRQPESVILFDEIEKAHRSIFDLFLQLFDDGRLTNAQGKTGDFTKSLIIMTSNIGFERKEPTLGFGAEADREQAMIDSINDSLAGFFRPEFLNRIDEKIVFSSLDYDAVLKITDHLLEKEADMIAESGVRIRFSPEVAKFIADRYYDETNGARPIQRGIVREVEDVLTQSLMDGTVRKGKEAYADVFGGSIRIEPMLEVNLKPVDRQDECDLEERMNRAVDDVLKNMQ